MIHTRHRHGQAAACSQSIWQAQASPEKVKAFFKHFSGGFNTATSGRVSNPSDRLAPDSHRVGSFVRGFAGPSRILAERVPAGHSFDVRVPSPLVPSDDHYARCLLACFSRVTGLLHASLPASSPDVANRLESARARRDLSGNTARQLESFIDTRTADGSAKKDSLTARLEQAQERSDETRRLTVEVDACLARLENLRYSVRRLDRFEVTLCDGLTMRLWYQDLYLKAGEPFNQKVRKKIKRLMRLIGGAENGCASITHLERRISRVVSLIDAILDKTEASMVGARRQYAGRNSNATATPDHRPGITSGHMPSGSTTPAEKADHSSSTQASNLDGGARLAWYRHGLDSLKRTVLKLALVRAEQSDVIASYRHLEEQCDQQFPAVRIPPLAAAEPSAAYRQLRLSIEIGLLNQAQGGLQMVRAALGRRAYAIENKLYLTRLQLEATVPGLS